MLFYGLNCGFRERLHLDKPLLGNARLNNGSAAVAGTDIVLNWFYFDKIALFFQVVHNPAARFKAGKTGIFPAVFIDASILVHHIDDGQVVPEADFKVIRIVSRGNFHYASSKITFHIFIRNDRDFTPDKRQDECFSDKLPVPFVIRMNCDGGIA